MPLFGRDKRKKAHERVHAAAAPFESELFQITLAWSQISVNLDSKFGALCTDSEPYLWLNGYELLPTVGYDDVSWGFGEMVQKIKWIAPVQEQIPEDFRWTIPSNANVELAREGRERILYGTAHRISEGLNAWAQQRTFQIDESDAFMPEFVVNVLASTLFRLRFLVWDLKRVETFWNGGFKFAESHEAHARWWLACETEAKQRLNHLVRSMPFGRLESLGFIDEMWESLGVDFRRGF